MRKSQRTMREKRDRRVGENNRGEREKKDRRAKRGRVQLGGHLEGRVREGGGNGSCADPS